MSVRRSEDSSSGPGMTPIDSPSPTSPTDRRTEPDRTTGHIPAQDEEGEVERKSKKNDQNRKAGA